MSNNSILSVCTIAAVASAAACLAVVLIARSNRRKERTCSVNPYLMERNSKGRFAKDVCKNSFEKMQ